MVAVSQQIRLHASEQITITGDPGDPGRPGGCAARHNKDTYAFPGATSIRMSNLRIFIVIMELGTLRGSIQDRRTCTGRTYHWAIASDRETTKFFSFDLHAGCPIYATFLSTQVRVPPGARNFFQRKFISFLPFLLSLFVSVETSTLSSSTRALPRDKEEFLPLSDHQWYISHGDLHSYSGLILFDYYFCNFGWPHWGSNLASLVPQVQGFTTGPRRLVEIWRPYATLYRKYII